MPAIPASTKSSVTLRLLDHAETHWPQLKRVEVTYRGAFAYISGVLADGEQIPLCRLRYGGSAHSFGFAIYSAARDRYEDSVLRTGFPGGTPQEALDTACSGFEGTGTARLRSGPCEVHRRSTRGQSPRAAASLSSQAAGTSLMRGASTLDLTPAEVITDRIRRFRDLRAAR